MAARPSRDALPPVAVRCGGRTCVRRVAVVVATGALLTAAPAAIADIPADPVAWITARGEAVDWRSTNDIWFRSATVVADGPLEGRPGNRHTATVDANPTSLGVGGRPGPVVLAVTLTLREEDCPVGGGACRTLWAGTGSLPYIATVPVPGADGSVRVQAPVPASVFATTEPPGAPVPFGDTQLDVTLTPRNWQDPRKPDTLTADNVTRHASEGGDGVSVSSHVQGTGMSATGSVAGVPAQRVTAAGWWDRGGASGSAGPGLPPVLTPADAEPYLPAVRRQRVNRFSYGSAFWDGQLAVSGPLVTSTGYRLPGNTWRAGLYSQIILESGDRVDGVRPDGASLGLEGRQCATGQSWDDCAPVTMPVVSVPPAIRYHIRFGGAIDFRFVTPISEELPNGTQRDRGTLDVRVSVGPNGPGHGTRFGWLVRGEQRTWQYTATLRHPATASMTVAGHPVTDLGNSDTRYIEYATMGSGTL